MQLPERGGNRENRAIRCIADAEFGSTSVSAVLRSQSCGGKGTAATGALWRGGEYGVADEVRLLELQDLH
jgi:hypothetical protein